MIWPAQYRSSAAIIAPGWRRSQRWTYDPATIRSAVATARELMLWLLEAGHTPQHLSLNLSSGAALEQAIALEVEVLQSQGKTTLATALAEHTPSASQRT